MNVISESQKGALLGNNIDNYLRGSRSVSVVPTVLAFASREDTYKVKPYKTAPDSHEIISPIFNDRYQAIVWAIKTGFHMPDLDSFIYSSVKVLPDHRYKKYMAEKSVQNKWGA